MRLWPPCSTVWVHTESYKNPEQQPGRMVGQLIVGIVCVGLPYDLGYKPIGKGRVYAKAAGVPQHLPFSPRVQNRRHRRDWTNTPISTKRYIRLTQAYAHEAVVWMESGSNVIVISWLPAGIAMARRI